MKLIIISLFLTFSNIYANNKKLNEADTIVNNIEIRSNDYLYNQARENKVKNFDSVEKALRDANRKADSLKDSDKQIKALILLGHLYFDNAYFENSENVFKNLLSQFYSELSDDQIADIKHTLGLNQIRFSNYDQAINLFQEAMLIYEKTDNRVLKAEALKDIGAVYYYLGNQSLALDNYQKSLIIYREVNDSDGIAKAYNNIGMIFRDKGNINLALEYLNRSLEIKRIQNNQYGIANTLGNIGDAYIEAEEYEKAIEYFNEALEMWITLDYLHGMTEVYNYLGDVYIRMGQYDKAIANLVKGQKISLENNFKQRLVVNYELLSEAYYQISDYKDAYLSYKGYNALKDSVYEALSNQKIEEYLVRYENIKREKELIDQNRKIIIQRSQIILTLIVLLAVVVFLIMIIRQNKLIKKKSKKIQKINKELDLRVHKKTSELRIAQFSIDMAGDAIFWIKKNGDIYYVNKSASTMLDYSSEDLVNMSIFDLVLEFSEDAWAEYWNHLKEKGSYVIQLYYKTRMGNEIPVEAAFNFREFEGEEFNFVFSRNIYERKLSEEKLKNAKEKAERSDRLKSAFLANMSHEIRTPMNAIIGFVNLLGDPDITQDQKNEIVDLAQSSSDNLLNIVNDIIDISKIEADELVINKSLNYVNGLLKGIYNIYIRDAIFLQKTNLSLKIDLEDQSDKLAIFTDKLRFTQIMSNFMSNAIKFTDFGEITIGYTQMIQGGRKLLKFYVRDTGLGIPEEKLNMIFDRFNQLMDDRTKLYKGTGLGLAISKKLIDLLGGHIGVDSKEGEGSEFYFTLPYQILDHPEKEENKEIQAVKAVDWSNKTILIVEDTPSNYHLIEKFLKPSGIKMLWAKSGKEAIDLFKQDIDFDLVLMDIQLPGINGYEATKLIKAYNKKVPVIAQTAYALSGERENSMNEGCDDYIAKPIKREMLYNLLSKHFD